MPNVVAPLVRQDTRLWPVRMAHASLPERTRSLPNGDIHPRDVDFRVEALLNFRRRSQLKEKLERLAQVVARLFYRVALAGDIEFWTKRGVAACLALDNGGKLCLHGHHLLC